MRNYTATLNHLSIKSGEAHARPTRETGGKIPPLVLCRKEPGDTLPPLRRSWIILCV